MSTQPDNEWQEEFDMNFNLHDYRCKCYFPTILSEQKYEDPECPHVIGKKFFISSLLKQKASLKQKVIKKVPTKEEFTKNHTCDIEECSTCSWNEGHSNGFNDCREQTLKALNEID